MEIELFYVGIQSSKLVIWSPIHSLGQKLFLPWKWKVKVKVTQSCLTLCDPMDCIVHGILQARILEWVAFPFSRGSSQPRDRTQVSWIAGRFFTSWATNVCGYAPKRRNKKPSQGDQSRWTQEDRACSMLLRNVSNWTGNAKNIWELPEWALTELPKQKSISCSVLSDSLGPHRL